MPCSAAALVTSGSLAAPSSIEYSVCTCRCTNESDGLLTSTPRRRSSCPFAGLLGWLVRSQARSRVAVLLSGRACPADGNSIGRPAGKTRSGGSILALPKVYSEGLTGRVFSQWGPRAPHHSQGGGGP